MKILFVHQNFPAQYARVVPALAEHGHELRALIPTSNKRPVTIPADRYAFDEDKVPERHPLVSHFAEHVRRGEAIAKAADALRKSGYVPDVICGHLGWGETLFLKDVWPRAKLIVYAEFFYRNEGLDVGFDPEFKEDELAMATRVTSRQASLLLAMNGADLAQAPTRWQKESFPAGLQDKIRVVHEGIDTDFAKPDKHAYVKVGKNSQHTLRPGDEVLTFVNRNLEPYRGYHIFMRALPRIMERRKKARVIIVGGNDVSYGSPPRDGRTWRDIFLAEVKDRLDMSRVHFVGQVPHGVFMNLMQVSMVHAYLTYPFVLSWSMLEAMSCAAHVIGSRTPPVEEVIRDGKNGTLVDFFDVEAWSEAIIEGLAHPKRFARLRESARQTVVKAYDMKTVCLPQQVALVEGRHTA